VSDAVVYLDSSALLKLIFEEPESAALASFLEAWPARVSSALARVEVTRIVARVADPASEREAQRVLNALHLVRIDDGVVASAATMGPRGLRSLDAIHLATAHLFGHHLAGLVAYDRRLAQAARHHAITVWAPA
jgi:predicted nucleic acid-binding protein